MKPSTATDLIIILHRFLLSFFDQLRAFERFLHDYPEWSQKVVLIQVTSPSPGDSPALATKVSELVDSINGTYGSLEFQPVHHYHQTIERDVCRYSFHLCSCSPIWTEDVTRFHVGILCLTLGSRSRLDYFNSRWNEHYEVCFTILSSSPAVLPCNPADITLCTVWSTSFASRNRRVLSSFPNSPESLLRSIKPSKSILGI